MTTPHDDQTISELARVVGAGHVDTAAESLTFVASDFFIDGHPPLAVVAPGTVSELCAVVRAAADRGRAIVARGAGLSYTGGAVPAAAGAVMIDTRRLNRILDISPQNMTVTAEAGATWENLHAALAEHGLRVPSFGPSTGRYATLGGSLSNNAMFFGAANRGTVADSVLGLDVVLADGRVLATGSGAIDGGTAFFRHHGPDLTGLFLADAGAMGVKAAATLALERTPAGIGFASFAFKRYADMILAAAEIARTGLAAECLGVGAYVPGGNAAATPPSLHMVVEGWTPEIAAAHLGVVKQIAGVDGAEIEPAMPKFLRAQPFGFAAHPLDAKGRLQIWTHGVFPLGQAGPAYAELCRYFDTWAEPFARHQINLSISVAVAGRALLLEPVMAWSDRPRAVHERTMGPLPEPRATRENPAASSAVREARVGLRDLFARLGAAHMQIGKFYGLGETVRPAARQSLKRLKQALDPQGIMNPGALGL
ncbi:MAG: FAD-binding oxidoreductase [Rhodospirillaceae bacterium]|nr:FAD-binding oxidoreductase [Rhodospirillaceae bacterium]